MAIVEAGDEEYQDSYLGKIGAQQNGQREKVFLDDIAAAIDSIIGSISDIKVDWKEVDFAIMKALEFCLHEEHSDQSQEVHAMVVHSRTSPPTLVRQACCR